jgi:predicted enzyme related to lactoylglutathione lyase
MTTLKKTKAKKAVASKMNPVVHFEFPTDDRKRISSFYKKAFGWKTKMLGKKNESYVLATTAPSDKDGRPKETARINGGFYTRKDNMPSQHPSVVIAVDDIQAAMKRVTKAGGRVLGEPVEIPGYGLYVSFLDTENNRVSIMEPFMMG